MACIPVQCAPPPPSCQGRAGGELCGTGEPDHLDITSKEGGEGGNGDLCQDPLLEEAIQTVLETGMASSSGLQRRFRVGYTRAARMIDAMEALGIVGPQTSRGREILVDEQRAEELLQEARTG